MKGEIPHSFVLRFKRIFGDFTAIVGKMTLIHELFHFQGAVIGNPRCRVLFIKITINKEDLDLMDQVHQDFLVVVELHQITSMS